MKTLEKLTSIIESILFISGTQVAIADIADKLEVSSKDIEKAVVKLTKSLYHKGCNFVTLIYGEDVSEQKATQVEEAVRAKLGGDVEITLISGGQPVYYYIISVE